MRRCWGVAAVAIIHHTDADRVGIELSAVGNVNQKANKRDRDDYWSGVIIATASVNCCSLRQ
jgi:hypothetical protein